MTGQRGLPRAASVWILCLVVASAAQAQTPSVVGARPSGPALQYQSIFIPDAPRDLLEKEMAKSGVKYLPVTREEFQDLLRAVNAAPLGPGGASAKLTQASYSARLQGADLVAGEARLVLEHRSTEPSALGLEPCTLSIHSPKWIKPSALPARLGADASGRLAVLVEPAADSAPASQQDAPLQAAELRFGWTLRGARDPSGALLFDLQVPTCTTSQLELDLPRGLTPVVDHGVVTIDSAAQNDQRQKWLIELGGFAKTTLTLVPSEELTKSHRYVLLKQAATYDLTPQSLEASFELNLDVYHEPLRQLALTIDPELHVTSVRLGDKELPWTITPAADNTRKLVVEFAEPLQGADRVLRIAALAPMKWDTAWRLPALRVEGAFWQEGTISLQSPLTLNLRDLVPQRCRQTKTSALVAPRAGELRQFQCLAAQGSLTIVASRPSVRLSVQSGLTLKWEEADIQGRAIFDLTAEHGQTFQLHGAVPADWTIDNIETVPAEALDDWSFTAAADQPPALHVRLAQSISPQRGVRLVVMAHRRAPSPDQRLVPQDYRLVQFRDVAQQRQLVSVHVEAQQQLDLAGDAGLLRLDPAALTDRERALVDTTASRLLYVDETTTPQFGLQVRDESARYAAEVNMVATLGPASLTEGYRIVCTPDGTPVSRVVVQIAPRRKEALQWQITGEPATELSARLLTEEERRTAAFADEEIWELTLQHPHAAPFELVAQRSREYRTDEPRLAVALAALPEAESQSGRVEVQAAADATPFVEALGLKPLTPPAQASLAVTPLRAVFSYKPTQEQTLYISHASQAAKTPQLWAWRSELTCRLNADGRRVQTMRYDLENTGRASLELRLRPGFAPRDIHVNAARVAIAGDVSTGVFRVPLPATQRYSSLVIEYEDPAIDLPLIGSVTMHMPQIDVPVLERQLRLCLPPALALADVEHPGRWGWRAVPNWAARLFGPLARPTDAPPPDLFALESWRKELGIDALPIRSQQRAKDCWLAWDQLLAPSRGATRATTLGQWVQRYDRLASDNPEALPRLRIDEAALSLAHWQGDSKLPSQSAGDSASSASELFRRACLVLLLTDQEVLLTTRARQMDEAIPSLGSLPVELAFIANEQATVELFERIAPLKPAAWLAQPQPVRRPWAAADATECSELAASGWRVQSFPIDSAASTQIVIYRVQQVRALALGLFLFTGGGMYWLLGFRRRSWLWALAVAVVFALALPAPLAIWGTATLLGTLVAMLARLADRRRRPRLVSSPASTMTHQLPKAMLTGSALLVIGALTLHGLPGWAQESLTAAADTVHRVLIPVDEQQQPSGKHVYLPQPFYEALSRQAKAAKSAPQGWMIYDATYRGRLQWEKVGEKLNFADLVAVYEIEVFQPGTRVTIGLGRESVHLLDDRVNLDDQLVRIQWLENGAGFVLPVEKAGRYRLELALKPTVRASGVREEVDLKIPRLARSHLILKMPTDATGVQVPGALGATLLADPGELQVELGPVERLAVHWRTNESAAAATGEVEATQLLWWKIRPGATALEATWRFKSTGQPLREVRLIADPRLRLLPLDPKEPVAEHFVRDGDVKAIQFVLKEPYEREVTLHTTFALTGSSGVGSLTLPQLDAVADRTTRRWLAVSTTATLDATLESQSTPAALSAQEFLTAWGEAEATPQTTYRLDNAGELVAFSVQPREPSVSGQQSLVYSLRRDAIDVELSAQQEVSDGQVFQHRLAVPPGLSIGKVQLVHGETARPVRYALSTDQSLVVFLPSGQTGSYAIKVSGRLPLVAGQAESLPILSCTQPPAQLAKVTVRRASEVQTIVEADSAYREVATEASPADTTPWRTIASWQPIDPAKTPPIKLAITPNQPLWKAQQVLRVARQGDGWQSLVDCYVDVSRGAVDFLRLEVPSDWKGPYRSNLPATFQLVEVPGQVRRQLIVSLQQPQTQAFHLQIAAPLELDPGERLQAPEVALLDGEAVESFVVLPSLADQQAIGWETRGLQATELRPELRELSPANTQAFLVVGARYQATIRRVDAIAGVPQVRLADARLVRRPEGSYFGVVSFDLEPAGLTHGQLEMPPGSELVHVTVGDLPAVLQRIDDTHWQFLLHHEQLPQHLEVLFTAVADSVDELRIPALAGLPVERTLWTILPGDEHSAVELASSDSAIDASRQTMFRLRNSAAMLEQASSLLSDSDSSEISAWFVPWVRRSTAAQAWFVRQEAARATPSVSLQNEMQALLHDSQSIAQQWEVDDLATMAAGQSTIPSGLGDDLLVSHIRAAPPLMAMLPGSGSSLQVQAGKSLSNPIWPRWLAGAIILALLGVAGWLAGSALVADLASRWPQLIGVALALAWWIFLQPAWVAVVLLVLLAIVSLRWPWPTVSEPMISSFSSRVLRFRRRR